MRCEKANRKIGGTWSGVRCACQTQILIKICRFSTIVKTGMKFASRKKNWTKWTKYDRYMVYGSNWRNDKVGGGREPRWREIRNEYVSRPEEACRMAYCPKRVSCECHTIESSLRIFDNLRQFDSMHACHNITCSLKPITTIRPTQMNSLLGLIYSCYWHATAKFGISRQIKIWRNR